MVAVFVDILPQTIPASVNQSYMPFGFWKLGLGCWVYPGGYDGEIEWINTIHFMTINKHPNPTNFRFWLQPGIQAYWRAQAQVTGASPDVIINAGLYNPTTGKGFPLSVP